MRCPVCNQILGDVTPTHVKKHGYKNLSEFYKDYPKFQRQVEAIRDYSSKRVTQKFKSSFREGVQL